MNRYQVLPLLAPILLAACASGGDRAVDESLTIASLDTRAVNIQRESIQRLGREKVIRGYREFLSTLPDYPLRAEAMRRLADLELERSTQKLEQSARRAQRELDRQVDDRSAEELQANARLYENLLKSYPYYPGNDRVLYQLAKVYDSQGLRKKTLETLNRLTRQYPDSHFIDEVQFRRGEILFSAREYADAGLAYKAVVNRGDESLFFDKALFMYGWSLFKQSRYNESAKALFSLVDRKHTDPVSGAILADPPPATGSDKDLLDDAVRAATLGFSNTGGASRIAAYFNANGRRPYEYRVYAMLGDLYLKQGRIRDAAQTYDGFERQHVQHPKAPLFGLKVIDAWRTGKFPRQELAARQNFIVRYGADGAYWKASPPDRQQWLAKELKPQLIDVAKYWHAAAQKERKLQSYQQATRWYGSYVKWFPQDAQTPQIHFLLGEAYNESRQYAQAIAAFEATAYDYPAHARSAEAGYAALLAYTALQQQLKTAEEKQRWRNLAIDSNLHFADAFPQDRHTPSVLARTAEELFAAGRYGEARVVADRVIALGERAAPALRKTAWTVVAHTDFEQQDYAAAERGYGEVLKLTPRSDPQYRPINDRMATSVYKQGEAARSKGDNKTAVAQFLRVGQVAPASAFRATAEYDAAAILIGMKSWSGAIRVLEGFRQRYPGNKLQSDVNAKLAVAYLETGNADKAAAEFERMGAAGGRDEGSREAMWRAGELYQKAGRTDAAIQAYTRYISLFPQPLEPAMEARHKLAEIYREKRDGKQWGHWLNEIVRADQSGGRARTDRTRYLAANAIFLLAEPYYRNYREVRLTHPLKKSLALKKEKLQSTLKAYGRAADYGVAEVTTACTYRIAEIYADFGQALLKSERPKNLNKEEMEQYTVLLEEQAFPFEEKAIEAHEVNTARASQGVYDKWVKSSFMQLTRLKPARYAKSERGEEVLRDIH